MMSQQLILTFMVAKTGSPISKLVLLKLADNADAHGLCFPSYDYLAQYCEVSVRTVKHHVNQLESLGFLSKLSRFDKRGRQRSNLYQLQMPAGAHIELAKNFTGVNENAAPPEGDQSAPITCHIKNKDQEGGSQRSLSPLLVELAPNVFTLFTKQGEHPVTSVEIQRLIRRYPNVDVMKELNAMRIWLCVNPDKRKHNDGVDYFINGWLRRSAKVAESKLAVRPEADTATANTNRPTPPRAIDTLMAAYQKQPQKHPIEQRIQNFLRQQHSARKA